jgi:hypothetical protein
MAKATKKKLEPRKFWHMTKPEYLDDILKNGLKASAKDANCKYIFLLHEIYETFENYNNTKVLLTHFIASNQLGLREWVLLEIDSDGIEDHFKIKPDVVYEKTSWAQVKIKQEIILPEYITVHSKETLNMDILNEYSQYKFGFAMNLEQIKVI